MSWAARTQQIAVLVGTVAAIGAVAAFITWYPERQRQQRDADSALAAKMLTRQAETTAKSKCLEMRQQQLDEFQALVQQRRLNEAFSVLNDCAQATGDAQLQALAARARIADLLDTAQNPRYFVGARLTALDLLLRDYPTERTAENDRLHAKLVKLQEIELAAEARRTAARKRREGVSVGMTKDDVLASAWGRPEKINRSSYNWGTREQWVYRGNNYLYFHDDTLESIQTSHSRN